MKDACNEQLYSISEAECKSVFRFALYRCVETSNGDVGVAERFLDLAMSASCGSAWVAVVALSECTLRPFT